MAKLLKAKWVTMLAGCVLYLLVTGYCLAPAKVFSNVAQAPAQQGANISGAAWEFFNPEMDRLMTELAREKKVVVSRQEQLDELATRLEAERAELSIVLQSVQRTQKEFDRGVLRVREEETANLKKLAKVYANMTPEGAALILKQMEDDQIAKFLVFMKESETAPLLESFAKLGQAETKRAAALSERLRTTIFRNTPPKQ